MPPSTGVVSPPGGASPPGAGAFAARLHLGIAISMGLAVFGA